MIRRLFVLAGQANASRAAKADAQSGGMAECLVTLLPQGPTRDGKANFWIRHLGMKSPQSVASKQQTEKAYLQLDGRYFWSMVPPHVHTTTDVEGSMAPDIVMVLPATFASPDAVAVITPNSDDAPIA